MLDAVVMQMPVWEGETCQNVWHNLRARADIVHSSKMEVKHTQTNPLVQPLFSKNKQIGQDPFLKPQLPRQD